MALVGKRLSFFIFLALISLVAGPVVATNTVQYVPSLWEIRNLESGTNGPNGIISYWPRHDYERSWTSFILSWVECQLADNGTITRASWGVGGTGDSVAFGAPSGNNTWLEKVRLTVKFNNQGYNWPVWSIYIPTMRNEHYIFELIGQPEAWGYNASYHYFTPYPLTVPDENIYFYRDKDRLDSIMANASNMNLTNRATFYAYATGLDLRSYDVHARLIETGYTNETAATYALECVDWVEYALSQSYIVQSLARYNGSNITVLKSQTERLWMNYEIAAYLQLAALWAQQGWTEGSDWAFDYAYSLYDANYEHEVPVDLPIAPAASYDILMLAAAGGGVLFLLVGAATKNPAVLMVGIIALAIAGALWKGYL